MVLLFSENAKKQLEELPHNLKPVFPRHLEKIQSRPPRRHMKYGIPIHVEEITRDARIIYKQEKEDTYIIQCFRNPKEYENWYKSYK